jgi:hypothetical protein
VTSISIISILLSTCAVSVSKEKDTMLDPAISAFIGTARQYCAFIDSAASLDLLSRMRTAAILIAKLCAQCLELPDFEEYSRTLELPDVSPPWPSFGEYDGYTEIFDCYADKEPVGASLGDDLYDIYFDISRGLLYYREGDRNAIACAVITWKYSFFHWGQHATGALRALVQAMVLVEHGQLPGQPRGAGRAR